MATPSRKVSVTLLYLHRQFINFLTLQHNSSKTGHTPCDTYRRWHHSSGLRQIGNWLRLNNPVGKFLSWQKRLNLSGLIESHDV